MRKSHHQTFQIISDDSSEGPDPFADSPAMNANQGFFCNTMHSDKSEFRQL